MLVEIGTGVVGLAVAGSAADIAAWCFGAAAASEPGRRRHLVGQARASRGQAVAAERAEQRDIQREACRRVHQEAYEQRGAWLDMLTGAMGEGWQMRRETRGLLPAFWSIIAGNPRPLPG